MVDGTATHAVEFAGPDKKITVYVKNIILQRSVILCKFSMLCSYIIVITIDNIV